jgi:hypothetical protein
MSDQVQNSETHCTEFTTEHGLTNPPDDICFACVCPKCGKSNPLKGDPSDFQSQSIRCLACTGVLVLDAAALDQFSGKMYDNE